MSLGRTVPALLKLESCARTYLHPATIRNNDYNSLRVILGVTTTNHLVIVIQQRLDKEQSSLYKYMYILYICFRSTGRSLTDTIYYPENEL